MRTAAYIPDTDVKQLAAKVRQIATASGLTSYMNDTKWRELCHAFDRWPTRTTFRIHSLLAAPAFVSAWDGEWYYHPYPYVDIYWLEIRVPAEAVAEALSICKQVGAAIEVVSGGLKVWGWVGSADRPQFA